MDTRVSRILDANINRVSEGLRVVEDIMRYGHDRADFQESLKKARHTLMGIVERRSIIPARDASGDVGLESEGGLEMRRSSELDLVVANMKRAQEGLRVIEEALKLVDPAKVPTVKRLRYEVYDLERDITIHLEKPLTRGLYLIAGKENPRELARLAVEAKLPAVQLRLKNATSSEFLEIALDLRAISRGTSTLFIVDDRPDIAVAAEADGVHVGRHDMDPVSVRKVVGSGMLVGLSTHDVDQVIDAENEPVDYIGFGPVFPTLTKENPDPVTGVEALAQAVEHSIHPVVAIGGIGMSNIVDVAGAGAHGAAVVSAVGGAKDKPGAIEELKQKFQETL